MRKSVKFQGINSFKVVRLVLQSSYGIFLRQNGEPVNISLVKWNLGDIVNKTHVVLIIGQNKMCAKFRTLPNIKRGNYEKICIFVVVYHVYSLRFQRRDRNAERLS